jgi:hypothetical protein
MKINWGNLGSCRSETGGSRLWTTIAGRSLLRKNPGHNPMGHPDLHA